MVRLRKCAAFLLACVMGTTASSVQANAEGNDIRVELDQVTLTLDELEAMQYQVPVYVRVTENPGITSIEFGIEVDARCGYQIITKPEKAANLGGESLEITMTSASLDHFSWLVWQQDSGTNALGNYALVYVQVPSDATPGCQYDIRYVSEGNRSHIWKNHTVNYVQNGTVTTVDGWIQIAEEEETTPSAPDGIPGDVNADGFFTVSDIVMMQKYLLGKEMLTRWEAGDFDANGIINGFDLSLMKRQLLQ